MKCSENNCPNEPRIKGLCQRHYHAAYYAVNRKRIIERVKEAYAANPEIGRRRTREWVKENKAKKKDYDAAWARKNKDRHNAHSRAYYAANRAKVLAKVAARRVSDRDEYLSRERNWREENRELSRERLRLWKKKNPEKVMADHAKRRARKDRATPKWADSEKIVKFYAEAQRLSKDTRSPFHVDHIVPLRSKFVCGLHVEHNLQVLPGSENFRKSNTRWPDMPERI